MVEFIKSQGHSPNKTISETWRIHDEFNITCKRDVFHTILSLSLTSPGLNRDHVKIVPT